MYSKTSLLPTLCNRVQQRTSGLVGWLASSIRRMRTGNSSLSESWIKTTLLLRPPLPETTKTMRFVCCCFDFAPTTNNNSRGWGELEGGGGRKNQGWSYEREREKHHTEIKVGGLEGWAHSRLFPCVWCVVEHEWGGGANVCWQACWPASWLAVPPAVNMMTRWQQAVSVARALSCHRNLPLDTACWLAVSHCCCCVRLMKPRGWGRASGTAWSCFLVESVARHIRGQLTNKHFLML